MYNYLSDGNRRYNYLRQGGNGVDFRSAPKPLGKSSAYAEYVKYVEDKKKKQEAQKAEIERQTKLRDSANEEDVKQYEENVKQQNEVAEKEIVKTTNGLKTEYRDSLRRLKQKEDSIAKQADTAVAEMIKSGAGMAFNGNNNPRADIINNIKEKDPEYKQLVQSVNESKAKLDYYKRVAASFLKHDDSEKLAYHSLIKDSNWLDDALLNERISRENALATNNDDIFSWNNTDKETLADWVSKERTLQNKKQKALDFEDYLIKNNKLPSSINEIPSKFKDIAEATFLKDGKDLLKDQDFRNNFTAQTMLDEENISKVNEALVKSIGNITTDTEEVGVDKLKELRDKAFLNKKLNEGKLLHNMARPWYDKVNRVDTPEEDTFNILNEALERREKYNAIMKSTVGGAVWESAKDFASQYVSPEKGLPVTLAAGALALAGGAVSGGNPAAAASVYGSALTMLTAAPLVGELKNVARNKQVSNAINTLQKETALNSAQKNLAQAAAIYQLTNAMYDVDNSRRAYKWSNVGFTSLGFMAQFIASGGMLGGIKNATSKTGKFMLNTPKAVQKATPEAVKLVFNEGLAKFGKNKMVQNVLYGLDKGAEYGSKFGQWLYKNNPTQYEAIKSAIKHAPSKIAKAGKTVIDDSLYAAYLTSVYGLPKVYSDALTRSAGNIQVTLDANGDIVPVSVANSGDFNTEFTKAFTQQFVENFSEMMGEWAMPTKLMKSVAFGFNSIPFTGKYSKALFNGINQFLDKSERALMKPYYNFLLKGTVSNKAVPFLGAFLNYMKNFFSSAASNAQFHGFFGEILEEYYGIALNHIFGSQDKQYDNGNFWSDMKKNMLDESEDIWGGMLFSTALLSTIGVGTGIYHYKKFQDSENNLRKALKDDAMFEKLRSDLLFAGTDLIFRTGSIMDKFMQTKEQKKALASYLFSLVSFRASSIGEDIYKKLVGESKAEIQNSAYNFGYSEGSREMLYTYDKVTDLFMNKISSLINNADEKTYTSLIGGHDSYHLKDTQDILDNIFSLLSQVSSDTRLNAKEKKELQVALLSFYNINRYKEGINTKVTDTIQKQTNKLESRAKSLAFNGGDTVKPIMRETVVKDKYGNPVIKEDGTVETNTEVFYIINEKHGLNRKTEERTDEEGNKTNVDVVDTKQNKLGSSTVILAKPDGSLVEKKVEDLEGFEFAEEFSVDELTDAYVKQTEDSYAKAVYSTLTSISKEDVDVGATIIVGPEGDQKKITILGMGSVEGITFQIENAKGEKKQYTAKDIDEFKNFVDKLDESNVEDVTKFFEGVSLDQFDKYTEELDKKLKEYNEERKVQAFIDLTSEENKDEKKEKTEDKPDYVKKQEYARKQNMHAYDSKYPARVFILANKDGYVYVSIEEYDPKTRTWKAIQTAEKVHIKDVEINNYSITIATQKGTQTYDTVYTNSDTIRSFVRFVKNKTSLTSNDSYLNTLDIRLAVTDTDYIKDAINAIRLTNEHNEGNYQLVVRKKPENKDNKESTINETKSLLKTLSTFLKNHYPEHAINDIINKIKKCLFKLGLYKFSKVGKRYSGYKAYLFKKEAEQEVARVEREQQLVEGTGQPIVLGSEEVQPEPGPVVVSEVQPEPQQIHWTEQDVLGQNNKVETEVTENDGIKTTKYTEYKPVGEGVWKAIKVTGGLIISKEDLLSKVDPESVPEVFTDEDIYTIKVQETRQRKDGSGAIDVMVTNMDGIHISFTFKLLPEHEVKTSDVEPVQRPTNTLQTQSEQSQPQQPVVPEQPIVPQQPVVPEPEAKPVVNDTTPEQPKSPTLSEIDEIEKTLKDNLNIVADIIAKRTNTKSNILPEEDDNTKLLIALNNVVSSLIKLGCLKIEEMIEKCLSTLANHINTTYQDENEKRAFVESVVIEIENGVFDYGNTNDEDDLVNQSIDHRVKRKANRDEVISEYTKYVNSLDTLKGKVVERGLVPVDPTAQDKAVKELLSIVERQQAVRQDVSNTHYFVEVKDSLLDTTSLRLYKRVHTVMPSNYEDVGNEDSTKEHVKKFVSSAINLLKDNNGHVDKKKLLDTLNQDLSISEFINTCGGLLGSRKVIGDSNNDRFGKILNTFNRKAYVKYLEGNNDFNDDIAEEILTALAHAVHDKQGPSVYKGLAFDTLLRYILDDSYGSDENPAIDVKSASSDKRLEINMGGKVLKIYDSERSDAIITSSKKFEQIIEDILKIKEYYEGFGYRLFCKNPLTLTGVITINGQKTYVAGETDCIAIDKDGNRILIDFKTYNNKDHKYFGEKNAYYEDIKAYNHKDKTSWSQAAQYAQLLYFYEMLSQSVMNTSNAFIQRQTVMIGINTPYKKDYTIDDGAEIEVNINESGKFEPNVTLLDESNTDPGVKERLKYIKSHFHSLASNATKQEKEKTLKVLKFLIDECEYSECKEVYDQLNNTADNDTDLIGRLVNLAIGLINKYQTDNYRQEQEAKERLVQRQINTEINLFLLNFAIFKVPSTIEEYNNFFEERDDVANIDTDDKKIEEIKEIYKMRALCYYIIDDKLDKIKEEKDDPLNTTFEQYTDVSEIKKDLEEIIDKCDKRLEEYKKNNSNDAHLVETILEILNNTEVKRRVDSYTQIAYGSENGDERSLSKSVSTTNKETKLLDTINKYDGISLQNHVRIFAVKGITGDFFDIVFVIDGEEFTPVKLFLSKTVDGKLTNFSKNLKRLVNEKLENSDRVELNPLILLRTPGEFKISEKPDNAYNVVKKLESRGGVKVEDDYISEKISVKRDSGDSRVGITKRTNAGNIDIFTFKDKTGRFESLYTYKQETDMPKGVFVYIYKQTVDGETYSIPINLVPKQIDERVATLIYNLFNSIIDKNGEINENATTTVVDVDGNKYSASCVQILQMFVLLLQSTAAFEKNSVYFSYDTKKGLIIIKTTNGTRVFNTSDFGNSDVKTEFVDFIKNSGIKINISEALMNQDSLGMFLFGSQFDPDSKSAVELGGIKFELGVPAFESYMKAVFTSDVEGFENPYIRFDEQIDANKLFATETPVQLPEVKAGEIGEVKHVESVQESTNLVDDMNSLLQQFDEDPNETNDIGFDYRSANQSGQVIDEAEARQHIKDILGDVSVEFENDFLGCIGDGRVMGRCYMDCLKLSRKADAGVEYHEAFHRILELLCSDFVRGLIYSAYRKRSTKRGEKELADKLIAENVADLFMYYMQNRPKLQLSLNLIKTFKSIKNWINFFNEIGSFRLYAMFKASQLGLFKHIKPNKQTKQRFEKFAKDSQYLNKVKIFTKNGLNYDYIYNERQYKAARNSALLITFLACVKDYTGRNLNQFSLNSADIVNRIIKLIKGNKRQISSSSLLTLFDYFGFGILKGLDGLMQICITNEAKYEIAKKELLLELEKFKISAKTLKKQKEADENADKKPGDKVEDSVLDNEDFASVFEDDDNGIDRLSGSAIVKGELTRDADEFEPITRATPRTKLFFAGLAEFEEEHEVRILRGKEDKKVLQTKLKLNELGLPQTYDFRTAWARVLNRMYNVEGITDFRKKLNELSETSEFFRQVFNRFEKLYNQAFEEDETHQLKYKDVDAAASIIEIVKTIAHAKQNIFLAQAHQKDNDTEDAGSVKLINADKDYLVRDIKENWSAMLYSGETVALGMDASGRYYNRKDDADKYCDWFTLFMMFFRYSQGDDVLKNEYRKFANECLNKGITLSISYSNLVYKQKTDKDGNYIDGYESPEEETTELTLGNVNETTTIGGSTNKSYDFDSNSQNKIEITNRKHIALLKMQFIKKLSEVGITIELDDLDFLLTENYNDTGFDGMCKFFLEFGNNFRNPSGNDGVFISKLRECLRPNQSDSYKSKLQYAYSWNGNSTANNVYIPFINALAENRYKRINNDFLVSVTSVGGKKQYIFTERSFITDRLDELQSKKDERNELLDKLVHSDYHKVSRVLEHILMSGGRLEFVPIPGLKTDITGSQGIEYNKLATEEDYATKYAMLAEGCLIFPTLSDKTTYGGILGTDIFGIDYYSKLFINSKDDTDFSQIRDKFKSRYLFNGNTSYEIQKRPNGSIAVLVKMDNDVLDLFVRYAQSEYDSARILLERSRRDYPNNAKVANFDEGEKIEYIDIDGTVKTHVVQHGCMMSTFTGMYDENWNYISFTDVRDEDGKLITYEENLDKVYNEFLKKTDEEKRSIVQRILSNQVQKQLKELNELGMIKYEEDAENGTITLQNVELDRSKISRIGLLQGNVDRENVSDHYNTFGAALTERGDNPQVISAMLTYIGDMVCKELMSHQEMFRIYSGNLAYFKYKFDNSKAEECEYEENNETKVGYRFSGPCRIKDQTTDLFKRLGGLVSTGEHNITDIPGVKKEYVCAEIYDEEITSDIHDWYYDKCISQEYRRAFMTYASELVGKNPIAVQLIFDKLSEKYSFLKNRAFNSVETIYAAIHDAKDDEYTIDNETIKRILKDIIIANEKNNLNGEVNQSDLDLIAASKAEDVIKDIDFSIKTQKDAFENLNSNDGSTFITEDFCKQLLLMLGHFDDEIMSAFKLLTDPNNHTVSLTEKAEAYNKVVTTVIGAQKYTAYGQRPVLYIAEDGSEHYMMETYYDKTAYFPLFRCCSPGYTSLMLKKMKDEKVDVLMLRSANKIANKKGTKFDHETFKGWEENPDAFNNYHFNTYKLRVRDLRKQFNTDPNGKEYMPLGTQYQKIVLSLLQKGYTYDIYGHEVSRDAFLSEVMTCFNKITKCGYDEYRNKYYTDDGKRLDIRKFASLLQQQLKDKDASDPLLEAFSIEDSLERFKLPICALSSTEWVESIIKSMLDKQLIDVTTPGSAFYQRSAFAMEGFIENNDLIKASTLSEDDVNYTINHGAKLKEINEEGSSDCVLTIDYFDYLFEDQPGLKYQSFSQKKAWLIKNGIISGFDQTVIVENGVTKVKYNYIRPTTDSPSVLFKGAVYRTEDGKIHEVTEDREEVTVPHCMWKNAKANIVGYRIPTQAVSSIHAFRCVDVLPILRHTVILPKEITAVTGSDFDIDKFFLSTKFYHETPYSLFSDEQKMEIEGYKEDAKTAVNELKDENPTLKDEIEELDDDFSKISKLFKNQTALSEKTSDIVKKLNNAIVSYQRAMRTYSTLTDKFDENGDISNSRKYYMNRLIDLQLSLLKSTRYNLSKLHGSIDADTKPLEQLAKEINGNINTDYSPLDATSLRVNIYAKTSFAIGKFGIGPFALNNNNHVFTMLYDVSFKPNAHGKNLILKNLGLLSLHGDIDRNGHYILSWLSGLINAHVDVAKDPYIRSLGVNSYTYNLVNLLIRTGYGKETFYFTTLPIMKRMYSAYDKASGVYHQDETIPKSTRQKNAIRQVYCDFVKDTINKSNIEGGQKGDLLSIEQANAAVVEYFKKKYRDGFDIDSAIKYLMKFKKGVNVLREFACKSREDVENNNKEGIDINYSINDNAVSSNHIKFTYDEIQMLVAYAHNQLMEYAQDISNLVQYTKIDTKKQGNTVVEQASYYSNMLELRNPKTTPFRNIDNMLGYYDDENINNPDNYSKSFLYDKTRTMIMAQRELLGYQLFVATPGYLTYVNKMCELLAVKQTNKSVMKIIDKMFSAKIKAMYLFEGPNSYCSIRGIDPMVLLKSNNHNSIYYRLGKIKSELVNPEYREKYKSIIDENGVCTNYLLNRLIKSITVDEDLAFLLVEDNFEGAGFVRNQNIFDDNLKQDDIQNAWAALLDSDNVDLRKFAEDLIVYAFITSAATGKGRDIFKFVPPSWMIGSCDFIKNNQELQNNPGFKTFAQYHYEMLERLNNNVMPFSDYELFELIKNWHDESSIVPDMTKRLKSFTTIDYYEEKAVSDDSVSLHENVMIAAYRIVNQKKVATINPEDAKHFIKIKNGDRNLSGSNKYRIYELIGFGKSGDTVYPIYCLTDIVGGKYKAGNSIYSINLGEKLSGSATIASAMFNGPFSGDTKTEIESLIGEYLNTESENKVRASKYDLSDIFYALAMYKLNNSIDINDIENTLIYKISQKLDETQDVEEVALLFDLILGDYNEYRTSDKNDTFPSPTDAFKNKHSVVDNVGVERRKAMVGVIFNDQDFVGNYIKRIQFFNEAKKLSIKDRHLNNVDEKVSSFLNVEDMFGDKDTTSFIKAIIKKCCFEYYDTTTSDGKTCHNCTISIKNRGTAGNITLSKIDDSKQVRISVNVGEGVEQKITEEDFKHLITIAVELVNLGDLFSIDSTNDDLINTNNNLLRIKDSKDFFAYSEEDVVRKSDNAIVKKKVWYKLPVPLRGFDIKDLEDVEKTEKQFPKAMLFGLKYITNEQKNDVNFKKLLIGANTYLGGTVISIDQISSDDFTDFSKYDAQTIANTVNYLNDILNNFKELYDILSSKYSSNINNIIEADKNNKRETDVSTSTKVVNIAVDLAIAAKEDCKQN